MGVEEYDALMACSGQAAVCLEQMNYLRELVVTAGHGTENTDASITNLNNSIANVASYLQENYPNGRPDGSESESTETEGQDNSDSDNPYN